MRATEFEFYAPDSLEGAFEVLDRFEDEAKVLAGGMSMVPAMSLGLLRPAAVISLNHIGGLDRVVEENGTVQIGAMTRHGKVAGNDLVRRHFPLVADAASVIGDVQIRNRGTIGGSLVHADPAGDYLAPAVVLGAEFTLVSSKGSRTLAAGDFVVDIMRSGAGPTEILTEISIPKLPDGARTAYARLVRVEGNFAIVTAAAVVAGDTAKVAIGGATSRPVLIEQPAEPLRAGDAPAYAALGDAAYEACADAFGDMTSASEYRREMTRVYAQRSVRAALNPDEKRR